MVKLCLPGQVCRLLFASTSQQQPPGQKSLLSIPDKQLCIADESLTSRSRTCFWWYWDVKSSFSHAALSGSVSDNTRALWLSVEIFRLLVFPVQPASFKRIHSLSLFEWSLSTDELAPYFCITLHKCVVAKNAPLFHFLWKIRKGSRDFTDLDLRPLETLINVCIRIADLNVQPTC